ncbi:Transmembrane protein 65 [Perkinsus chesapeaki]|uniref:Transmembrane protein 65 n=1 Tax=Perkinsus chesapeaki TaxID=330153 RepID=A0A7J6N1U9_PERCH|nr:Transmembrane protein 65 [Perkinsus chesapeaki]
MPAVTVETLRGIYPPIATPFTTEGIPDDNKMISNINYWATCTGLTGIVCQGSNGEYVLLSPEERIHQVEVVRKSMPEHWQLLVGTEAGSTAATIELTKRVAAVGADAALVLTPSCYKSRMTDDAIVTHYTAIADASPIPVILYNMPANTGVDLSVAAICRLAKHKNIIGLKDSSGNVVKMATVRKHTDNTEFSLLAGSAGFLLPALSIGAVGGVCALANIAPQLCCDIQDAFFKGDLSCAMAHQHRAVEINTAVTSQFGVPGLKYAMDMVGLHGGPCRKPLVDLTDVEKTKLATILEESQATRVARHSVLSQRASVITRESEARLRQERVKAPKVESVAEQVSRVIKEGIRRSDVKLKIIKPKKEMKNMIKRQNARAILDAKRAEQKRKNPPVSNDAAIFLKRMTGVRLNGTGQKLVTDNDTRTRVEHRNRECLSMSGQKPLHFLRKTPWWKEVERFLESGKESQALPKTVNSAERDVVRQICKHFDCSFKVKGVGTQRQMYLIKPDFSYFDRVEADQAAAQALALHGQPSGEQQTKEDSESHRKAIASLSASINRLKDLLIERSLLLGQTQVTMAKDERRLEIATRESDILRKLVAAYEGICHSVSERFSGAIKEIDMEHVNALQKEMSSLRARGREATQYSLCVRCSRASATTAISPCGHVFCSDCASKIYENGKCEVCRSRTEGGRGKAMEPSSKAEITLEVLKLTKDQVDVSDSLLRRNSSKSTSGSRKRKSRKRSDSETSSSSSSSSSSSFSSSSASSSDGADRDRSTDAACKRPRQEKDLKSLSLLLQRDTSSSGVADSASPKCSMREGVREDRESGKLKRLATLQKVAAREDLHDKLATNPALEEALRCIQKELDQLKVDRGIVGDGPATSVNNMPVKESHENKLAVNLATPEPGADGKIHVPRPTGWQLRLTFLTAAIPFVGFGFLDNSIMLIAGDFIDAKLGAAFGITTLAAAALGNSIGDVSGIWLGSTVEALTHRMGLPDPNLTKAQRMLHSVALTRTAGNVVGVLIGCFLGMFPLIWPQEYRLWGASARKPSNESEQSKALNDRG